MQSKSVRVIQRLLSAPIVIAFLTNSNVACAAKQLRFTSAETSVVLVSDLISRADIC